jgi:uncharacterized membrane protein YhaH (DUF805 family)
MNHILQCCTTKYAKFTGRATRAEYWKFFVLYEVLVTILSAAYVSYYDSSPYGSTDFVAFVGFVLGVILLSVPMIAVSIRRLHDLDMPGWWFLMTLFIPPISLVIWFALMCGIGTNGDNRYGQALVTWVEPDPPPPERRIEHRKFGVYYYTYELIEES